MLDVAMNKRFFGLQLGVGAFRRRVFMHEIRIECMTLSKKSQDCFGKFAGPMSTVTLSGHQKNKAGK